MYICRYLVGRLAFPLPPSHVDEMRAPRGKARQIPSQDTPTPTSHVPTSAWSLHLEFTLFTNRGARRQPDWRAACRAPLLLPVFLSHGVFGVHESRDSLGDPLGDPHPGSSSSATLPYKYPPYRTKASEARRRPSSPGESNVRRSGFESTPTRLNEAKTDESHAKAVDLTPSPS